MKVTYLYHSGFSVEYQNAVFIFDYYKGELPSLKKDAEIYVFVSHAHKDHFRKSIFEWRKQYKKIYFVLSDDIPKYEETDCFTIGPDQEAVVGEVKIRTLRSTDEGVAFLIYYRDKVIYHAGDLNWWHWEGESSQFNKKMKQNYRQEIQKLSNEKIDLAFVVLDPRQERQAFWGIEYFLEHVHADAVYPMHMWEDYEVIERFLSQKKTEPYRSKIRRIREKGQIFVEEEGQEGKKCM